MDVLYKAHNEVKSRIVPLSEVLRPHVEPLDSTGALEVLAEQVRANTMAIGALLEYLVEEDAIKLEDAARIANVFGKLTPLD